MASTFEKALFEGMALIEKKDFESAKAYVKRMVGVLDGNVPNPKAGLHMFKARFNGMPQYTLKESLADIETIMDRVKLLQDAERKSLDEKYGTSAISRYISKCEEIIWSINSTDNDANNLGMEIFSIYDSKIENYEVGVGKLDQHGCISSFSKRDIPIIRGKLLEYRDEIIRDYHNNIAPAVHVEQISNQTTVIDISFNQTMSQMWALPNSALSNEEKGELAALLTNLENSKNENKTKISEAAKAVGSWLFDKGIEAIPTVMPYITNIIRSAMGA